MKGECATRIIHVIVSLEVGGAELMLQRLIQAHTSPRYRHSVIVLTAPGPVGEQLRAQGVEVEALGLQGVLDVLPKMFALTRMIRRARPDIVQTWMYHADLLGGLAARLAGRKNVLWGIRTTDITHAARTTKVVRWLCARLSRRVPRAAVCAAEASRRRHVAIGYDTRRMIVVPNGFDLVRLQATSAQAAAVRAEAGLDSHQLVVGTVGRFNEDKDPRNFVRAAGLLARALPDVHFLMMGRDIDDSNRTLKHWIAQTGCSDRFRLLGQREDVAACLAALDVFCLPSRSEGFPNVVGEAMAMRRACVVTDTGDAADLLGGCGIVVPKEDAVALAAGVERLLRMSAGERGALGERAHARIASEFTMARTRDRFEAIYLDMLKCRR